MVKPDPRGDLARLPKWTQDYIRSLVTLVDRQEAEIKKLSSEHPGSNLMLDGKVGYPAVSLPPNATVQFYLGEDRDDYHNLIEVHHNRNHASGRAGTSLEVTAYGGHLLVLPRVANGIALRLDEKTKF
jgi:hypothetical protein